MIEKSKKTSEASEKKAEPAKTSAANTLKSGLSGAKESNAPTAPGGTAARSADAPAASSSSTAAKAPGGSPTARPGDEIRSSSELQEKRNRLNLPQIGMVDQLRDAFGNGEAGEQTRSRAWSSKIGDILTGNSGRLRDLAGLTNKPVDTDTAQDPNGHPLKDADAHEIDAQAWRAWHRNQMQPNQPQSHVQQAQAASKSVASKGGSNAL